MIEITKRIEFDAGHRVPDHASKCRSPHGHRYVVEMAVTGPVLDRAGDPQNGMVLDFGYLKQMLLDYVHDPYDHAFLVASTDTLMRAMLRPHTDCTGHEADWKIAVLPCVPTAENLAKVIGEKLRSAVTAWSEGTLMCSRVTVWETPTCSAVWA